MGNFKGLKAYLVLAPVENLLLETLTTVFSCSLRSPIYVALFFLEVNKFKKNYIYVKSSVYNEICIKDIGKHKWANPAAVQSNDRHTTNHIFSL